MAFATTPVPLVTMDVVDDREAFDGDGSCPVEDDRLPVDDFLAVDCSRVLLPAFASASVMLLVYVLVMELAEQDGPLEVCCFSRLVAELEENFSSGCAVIEAVKPAPFLVTLERMEQLLNEAEFFTCVILLILSGTVQVELNEADR